MKGKKIHFAGIGGVGMAGLAVLLKAEGHEVSGCDLHASPRTRWLASLGIPVTVGHDPAHVADADEVVFTPAVRRDNPEFAAALAREAAGACRVRYRGEVLAELVSARESIAVCGSHGKTTTSTFIARLLLALGESVSWATGGETGAFPVAPFYAIDYGLAQVLALAYCRWMHEDPRGAWQSYLTFLRASGSHSFPEAIEAAGLESPFAPAGLNKLMDWLQSRL